MVSLDVMASTPPRADRAHLRKVVIGWGQPSRVAGASCGEIPGRGESLVTEPDGQECPQAWPGPTPVGLGSHASRRCSRHENVRSHTRPQTPARGSRLQDTRTEHGNTRDRVHSA